MATLALTAAGAALGSALLPTGVSLFGATLTGATLGAQIGGLVGGAVDQALFGPRPRAFEGPRLEELRLTGSSEGAPIPRLFGASRLGGQIIWGQDFEEVISTKTVGGKGGALGGGAERTRYEYFATFAIALCEGQISGIGRIWADDAELDLTNIVHRVHVGSELQEPDPAIVAEFGDLAPAFRGIAYVVIERLPITPYGNRVPQLSFEVLKSDSILTRQARAVVMIPGSGEFVYATTPVTRRDVGGVQVSENAHVQAAATDFLVSLDQLEAALPNVRSVSLVVSWFGTDLRAHACEVRPGVDRIDKVTKPLSWSVGGVTRTGAHVISVHDGRAAYGGTPSDATVIEAIRELKRRGYAVTLNPFILMDVPAANDLPNPYEPAQSQPPYPWRGRLTISPAREVAGTVDGTSAAASQIADFVGTAMPHQFAVSQGGVHYAGPAEWSYRRFVLHYAFLAAAAGGVDGFLIGSELVGLTTVRANNASFPFVAALTDLARDVKSILGTATAVTYGADWSEYFGFQPADGTGDVYFHLDPLWADPAVDAVGIDCYWPLTDWRAGSDHLDARETGSQYDRTWLSSRIAGGEGFDWYYANTADRAAQVRTPITDGLGKPWVFRFKDVRSWWETPHYERVSGVESAAPTAWVPQSKPIWFTELGCAAVDKAANQPNVFGDPKSSEGALPYFSDGRQDEFIQRRYIEAFLSRFDPQSVGFAETDNPISPIYGGRMVAPDQTFLYAWDARPFPAFPYDAETWGDGGNWRTGHWLNGRTDALDLADVVRSIVASSGVDAIDTSELQGLVRGLVIDRPMSAREALRPLELAVGLDATETGGQLRFKHRSAAQPVRAVGHDQLVEAAAGRELLSIRRVQDAELPRSVSVSYIARDGRFGVQAETASTIASQSGASAEARLALVLDAAEAAVVARRFLWEAWTSREVFSFSVAPDLLDIEPGDVIGIDVAGIRRQVRVVETTEQGGRAIEARGFDPGDYAVVPVTPRAQRVERAPIAGVVDAVFLDLPFLRGDEPDTAGYLAVTQAPWPGPIAVFSRVGGAAFSRLPDIRAPARVGVLLTEFPSGPTWRIDHAAHMDVELIAGQLESVADEDLLAGANGLAVEAAPGAWEVLQFARAELIGPRRYRLSRLLRGQAGTEADMADTVPSGRRVVILDDAVARIDLAPGDVGRLLSYRLGPVGAQFGGPNYLAHDHAFIGLARRPLAPVHLRAFWDGDDLAVNWIRRARTGGDPWEQIDVPIDIVPERYAVEVLNGATFVRAFEVAEPSIRYAAPEILADFGTPRPTLIVRVAQVGPTWGNGPAVELLIGP
ncbi:MAG: glycoside hydrolase/phage tail family protein [Hyphomicrobiaceae bacterium]